MSSPRNTSLTDVLFDVELRPLRVELNKTADTAALFDGAPQAKHYVAVPNYRAVVDLGRENVLCVVSPNYQLVANARAIELGKGVFGRVFGENAVDAMEVFHVHVPKTRSFCHIDYWHKGDTFAPWGSDIWVPFLRVTNSYNRTRLLRFDVGFCRSICTNGVIFGQKGVTIKYPHSKNAIPDIERVALAAGGMAKLKTQFIERLHNLQRYHVPEKEMLSLACKVFDVRADEKVDSQPKRVEQLKDFRFAFDELTSKYFSEMGENAYAALNVLTDFASRPTSYISPVSVMDSLQKKAGAWIDEFIPAIKDDKFKFDDYLKQYRPVAAIIQNLN